MRTIATRTLASVLAALLAFSCGTVRESRQPDIEERIFLPRAPRVVASPAVDELELRRAIEELLPSVNVEEARAELQPMVADPRFHGRQPGELRVVLASWGSGPVALEQIGREYRAWCAAVSRTNCHEGPLTDSSIYEIAFDFALGSQWDGFVGEVKSTIDPSTIRLVLLTGLVIFMATIAIPELLSKIPAAAATVVLTAYLGAQTARVLILLATAAIAQGGLIARLMKLPRATQASAALAAETGGVGLEAVGAIKGAQVLQGGVAITVEGAATGAVAVAMAANGQGPGASSGAEGGQSSRPANGTAVRPTQPFPRKTLRGVSESWLKRNKPRGWKQVPTDNNGGWKWLDENGTERLRFMRPNGRNPAASKWSRQANGYFRWTDEAGKYLDVDGNVVDEGAAFFDERTHIIYEGP
jgi:hypothetical protein